MSSKFTDIPADQWEREYFADELSEDRQADRPARVKASNLAAAFNALVDVAGFTPETHQALHIFLDKTKGKAPGEEVVFSEREAGALLPGDPGASHESLSKRWRRAWEVIESEMERTGKRIGTRIKGVCILPSRTSRGTKRAARYTSEIAQAVVDIERHAARMNGHKRDERFRRAALDVWKTLPAYVAPEGSRKIEAAPEPRGDRLAGRQTRRMNRWQKAAKEMIEEALSEGPEALAALRDRLHSELETLFADAESIHLGNTSIDNTEWTGNEPPACRESDGSPGEENPQIPSESYEFEPPLVDGAVHEEGSNGAVTEGESTADYGEDFIT